MSRSVLLDKPEAKWKSEPDLNSDYNCNSLEEDISGHTEDPHDEELFEFDIDSPASSEGNESIEFDSKPIINIIGEEEEDEVRGSCSISSDIESSSCSHRKESGVVVDGFSSIFGSPNSSLTDRRSILRQFEDSRGISVNPEEWKENGSLYLGGNLAAFSQKKSSEGSTSPILAVSPQVETDCPYISPDSVIGDDSLFSEQDLCFQCATSHITADTAEEGPQTKKAEEEILEDEENTLTDPVQPRSDDIMQRLSDRINANNKTVSADKLTNFLDKLGPIKEDSDYNEEEDISPLRLLHQNSLDVRPRTKIRKCSSLKGRSSPPRTSTQRKIVRFADILGLDLSQVKVFMDDIPKVPKAAYADLDVNLSDIEVGSPVTKPLLSAPPHRSGRFPDFSLVAMFNQPGGSCQFLETVNRQKVCLENAFMEGPNVVKGIVRVANISFQKAVMVRWTVNNWKTVAENDAEYVVGSSSGNTDKFTFRLSYPPLKTGDRLQFCLRYECQGEHWDSNNGSNYIFQVLANSSRSSSDVKTVPASAPAPVPIVARNQNRTFRLAASHSPSQHGDDPWLRFM